MKKLVTVSVSFDYVILVDESASDTEQLETAMSLVKDAINDMSASDFDYDLLDYSSHPAYGWDDECIPYGGDGNTRTKEYL